MRLRGSSVVGEFRSNVVSGGWWPGWTVIFSKLFSLGSKKREKGPKATIPLSKISRRYVVSDSEVTEIQPDSPDSNRDPERRDRR